MGVCMPLLLHDALQPHTKAHAELGGLQERAACLLSLPSIFQATPQPFSSRPAWVKNPVENIRMPAETIVRMNWDQKESQPMFLNAVPIWSGTSDEWVCGVPRLVQGQGDGQGPARCTAPSNNGGCTRDRHPVINK